MGSEASPTRQQDVLCSKLSGRRWSGRCADLPNANTTFAYNEPGQWKVWKTHLLCDEFGSNGLPSSSDLCYMMLFCTSFPGLKERPFICKKQCSDEKFGKGFTWFEIAPVDGIGSLRRLTRLEKKT